MRPIRSRRPPSHLAARTVTALTLAVLATGCAGNTAPSAPAPQPPPALVRYTTVAELASATGTQMKTDRTAKITVTGGLSGGSVQASTTGDGAISFDANGTAMTFSERVQSPRAAAPVEMTLVVLPDQAYVKPPPTSYPLPPGKSWLKLRAHPADPVLQQFSQLARSVRANADPAQAFTQYGDAATIVRSAEEMLDGVPTVRYQVRMDVAKAAAEERDPALKQQLQQTLAKGLNTVDSSLWVDARNRPLRTLVQQALPAGQGTYTVDARYHDWGQPVQISAPPPDQVVSS